MYSYRTKKDIEALCPDLCGYRVQGSGLRVQGLGLPQTNMESKERSRVDQSDKRAIVLPC